MSERILNKRQAAQYCNRSVADFLENFPYPPIDCGTKGMGYDMRDLDMWIDSMKGKPASIPASEMALRI